MSHASLTSFKRAQNPVDAPAEGANSLGAICRYRSCRPVSGPVAVVVQRGTGGTAGVTDVDPLRGAGRVGRSPHPAD